MRCLSFSAVEQEASKYGEAIAVASSADRNFAYIPDCSDLPISPDAAKLFTLARKIL